MGLKSLYFVLALALLLDAANGARDVAAAQAKYKLEEVSGGLVECLNALSKMKSCSNEIVLFFLNGQASIGPDCCRAIDVITQNCWPAMLSSLGFTPEQGNILRGSCIASAPTPAAPAPK